MEHPVKEGVLYVQHPKFGKKTWRKVWAQLFADSPSGIARLEYFDCAKGEKGTLKKGERKVIRLCDCVSVERAGEHSCPKDTTLFCLCLVERSCLLAAEQPDDWIESICQLAFQRPSAQPNTVGNTPRPQPVMEENAIYSSWQETCEYPVTVFPTEASTRCHLKGNYLMVPLPEQLVLKDVQSGQVLYTWPYTFLRRFGQEKSMFSFEAGRRCSSGEGLFIFNTGRAVEICGTVSAAIDRQKALLERDKKAGISLAQDSAEKTGSKPWPASRESLGEEASPQYNRTSTGPLERGDNRSGPPETDAPETPIIYASIGPNFPLLFQPCGKTEAEGKEQREQLSDHLYENLSAVEQGVIHHPSESTGFSYRDFPEGGSSSSKEPSPIYDNSPLVMKRSANHASLSPSTGEYDSFLERQGGPPCPQSLDGQEAMSGGETNAKPKDRGAGAFKHKLVTMLSRDGGAPKAASRSATPMGKSWED